jgi:flagellar hook-associated protein 1 FlgK
MAFETLNIGQSALTAFQTVTNVIGNNVSNAGTVGYTRQQVNLTALPNSPVGGTEVGGGVIVTDVSRVRSALLDVSYRSQSATSSAASARSGILNQAQGVIGTTKSGLSTDVSAFFTSWNTLSLTPTDSGARSAVIDAAQTVAQDVKGASSQLDQLTASTVAGLGGNVDQVNALSAQVADLNARVLAATSAGNTPNDLLDQRDNAVDQLVALTGATVRTDSKGNADVFVGPATLVRDNESTNVALSAAPGSTPTVTFADGSAVTLGGTIGGTLTALTSDIPTDRAQLDAFSAQFASMVNVAHAQGFDSSGNAGAAIFTGTTAATFAVSSTLTADGLAASASGSAADGNNALVMANLRTSAMSGGHSANDVISAIAGQLGQAAASAGATATAAGTSLSTVAAARTSADGVSTDSEMIDLLKYQRGYEAAARVVSVADKMLDTLINGMT